MYSSPGFGGSRWPWREGGVDEKARWWWSIDGVAFVGIDKCGEHSAVVFVAASIPRGQLRR